MNTYLQVIKYLNKTAPESIPEICKGYLEKAYKNQTIYNTRDIDSDSKETTR